MDINLDNFTQRTGTRFRVNKLQAARIALTELNDETRKSLRGLSVDQIADTLKARNNKGVPFNWVEEVFRLLNEGWNSSMQLTREQAFQEFLAEGGLEKLQKRRPNVPDSVYLDPTLTVDNFSEKAKAATGVVCRFRVSREQRARMVNKTLTREQALAEIVAAKKRATTAAIPTQVA